KRRQLAALQALRSLLTAGGSAPLPVLYFFISELLTPFAQAWVVAATAFGAASGWFGWGDLALVVLLLSFGSAAVSGAALLLRGSAAGAPDERVLAGLLLAAPVDFLIAGTAAACARTVGVCAFVRATVVAGLGMET